MRAVKRPALLIPVLALGALVVAGSALGVVTRHAATAPVYQKKCANGAVKAIVVVVADQNKGFQSDYTNDPTFFSTKWSCNAKAVFQARRVDRGSRLQPVVDHPDDRLENRRPDPVRPGAAQHELGHPVAQHRGRGHHAREPPPRWMAVKAERVEVLLPKHVVEVDSGARDDDPRARAVRAGHRARPALRVEHRDVGR